MKKRMTALLAAILILLCACAKPGAKTTGVLATTEPVAELAQALLAGTDVPVSTLISESISCLHDYTLSVSQMKMASEADVALLSGLGLEAFMQDALASCKTVIEAGAAISPLSSDEGPDPHIWLSPENMIVMTQTASQALQKLYPQRSAVISENETAYCAALREVQRYGEEQLNDLSCRSLITFHDGFAYFASAFGLEIAASMEIEPGSEPSARDLEAIITLIREENIPAIFVEANGTRDAAQIVARETGVQIYTLSTAMDLSEGSYEQTMKQNIDVIKEALE